MRIALALITALLATTAQAQQATKFTTEQLTVRTTSGTEKVHAEIARSSRGAQAPVFVIVNGLIYDLKRWNKVTDQLIAADATVIRFALHGQPENLKLLKKGEEPKYFKKGLELIELASEVDQVVKHFVPDANQKVHVVGLSYGAAVATEYAKSRAKKIESLVLVSPLVIPLESYEPNGQALRNWLNAIRFWENSSCDLYGAWNPYLCAAEDYWYDAYYNAIYSSYLDSRLTDAPKGIATATFKKAVFHLVRAVRDFDLRKDAPKLKNVHVIIAGKDSKPLVKDQELAWIAVKKEERRSLTVIQKGEHSLPEETPDQLAKTLIEIGNAKPELQSGERVELP